MINWLKSLFNKSASLPEETDTLPELPENPDQRDPNDPAYKETYEVFQTYWGKIGRVDRNVITYIVNPMFLGAPSWPGGRQAFSIIRTDESLIIASEGLAAPFDEDRDDQRNGFGMEVFVEVKGLQDISFEDINASPAFALIEQTARQVAGWGGITGLLDQINIASSEIPVSNDDIPDKFLTSEECVGVLFGANSKERPKYVPNTPLSPVRMVAVTALTSDEIQYVAQSKANRNQIVKKLMKSGIGHITDFNRDSLL